jgi:anti-sigma-K factor RskA
MTTEEVQDLIPLYALGALDVMTAREVERYLRNAPAAERRELAEFREIAALLPYALPASAAPVNLRNQLLGQVGVATTAAPMKERVAESKPSVWQRWLESFTLWPQLAAAAAALVVTVGCGYLYRQNQRLHDERLALTQQVASVKAEQQAQIEQVLAPLNRILTMKGVTAQNASAKIVWDTQQQRWLLQVYDLPAPPADKDYQLWYVTKDAKLSAAVFRPDARGRTTLELQLPSNVNVETLAATAVTLEPKGGVPQPTGQFYLLAQL